MKTIFLCHASEDKPIAEPIQLALSGAGYEVFYDENSLPPGGDYHDRIYQAIKQCDLFIFLISKASTERGKYTLTELKFAREKWSSPVNRVLPVNLEAIPTREIPHYLSATTILPVKGNPAAEVRAAAKTLLKIQRKKKLMYLLSIIITLGSIALAVAFIMIPVTPCGGDYRFQIGGEKYFLFDCNPTDPQPVPLHEKMNSGLITLVQNSPQSPSTFTWRTGDPNPDCDNACRATITPIGFTVNHTGNSTFVITRRFNATSHCDSSPNPICRPVCDGAGDVSATATVTIQPDGMIKIDQMSVNAVACNCLHGSRGESFVRATVKSLENQIIDLSVSDS